MNCIYKKNSREVKIRDTFFSIKGIYHNGNNFIKEAINNGAIEIIIQEDNLLTKEQETYIIKKKITYRYIKNIYQEFALKLKEFYKINSTDFVFFGVTGTKGKTTTANCLFLFLQELGYSAGLMSSAGHKLNNEDFAAEGLTTEMANNIYEFLHQAKQKKITYIVLEVSAQAFSQYRIFGIEFDTFIFSNFSQEHGESYKTQKDYFLAKCQLYNYMKKNSTVILNQNDKKVLSSKKYQNPNQIIKYFGTNTNNSYKIIYETIFQTDSSLHFKNETYTFSSRWCGSYNIENIFASLIAIDSILNLNNLQIKHLLNKTKELPDISGRNERYRLKNGAVVCIEKAPTPNSVLQAIKRLRTLTDNLIILFGCGGNKDRKKRPIIAKIIETYADTIIVTMDNPRLETLENIFKDISKGFLFSKNIFFIHNREEAIKLTIEKSTANSIIALIGKGDETYQDIKGIKYPFSEINIIKQYVI